MINAYTVFMLDELDKHPALTRETETARRITYSEWRLNKHHCADYDEEEKGISLVSCKN